MRLAYTIKYVADMDKAVAFHCEKLGLALRFASTSWSEFETGQTTLALHIANETHPPGQVELGFNTDDVGAFYRDREANGIVFTSPPTPLDGITIAVFLDSEGAENGVSS